MSSEAEDSARSQIALLCGLVAVIALGELLIGPPSAKAWLALDVFLGLAAFGAAGMLLRAQALPAAAWAAWGFLGGAILAIAVLALPNPLWIASHALALVVGVAVGGALLLRRG